MGTNLKRSPSESTTSQGKDGSPTQALVRPGPKLNAVADNDLTPSP